MLINTVPGRTVAMVPSSSTGRSLLIRLLRDRVGAGRKSGELKEQTGGIRSGLRRFVIFGINTANADVGRRLRGRGRRRRRRRVLHVDGLRSP